MSRRWERINKLEVKKFNVCMYSALCRKKAEEGKDSNKPEGNCQIFKVHFSVLPLFSDNSIFLGLWNICLSENY